MKNTIVGRFNRDVMFSSKDLGWNTPKQLFDELNEEWSFTLDPCTTKDNPLGTENFYTKDDDGLKQSWSNQRVFVNPEYGREYPKWVKKAYHEVREKDCLLAMLLIPARTDTKIFHEYCTKGEIWFLKGRLHFSGHKNPAPFPSMIVKYSWLDDLWMDEF